MASKIIGGPGSQTVEKQKLDCQYINLARQAKWFPP